MPKTAAANKAGGAKRERVERFTMPVMGRAIAEGLFIALNTSQKVYPATLAPPARLTHEAMNFLLKLKRTNPVKFSEHLLKLVAMMKPEDGDGEPVRYLIQQINVIAGPVPGVLNSPIAGHIAPPKAAAPAAEVIELAEPEPSEAARVVARIMAPPVEAEAGDG